MESHDFDELKSFEELAARARNEKAPDVDVRLYVKAALTGDALTGFEAAAAKSRREEAPADIDVRLLVRAALLTAPSGENSSDWMDVLLRAFRLPVMRLAMTACFVALFIASTAANKPPTTAAADSAAGLEDPVMAFLVTGE
jgi:hypothetical protein